MTGSGAELLACPSFVEQATERTRALHAVQALFASVRAARSLALHISGFCVKGELGDLDLDCPSVQLRSHSRNFVILRLLIRCNYLRLFARGHHPCQVVRNAPGVVVLRAPCVLRIQLMHPHLRLARATCAWCNLSYASSLFAFFQRFLFLDQLRLGGLRQAKFSCAPWGRGAAWDCACASFASSASPISSSPSSFGARVTPSTCPNSSLP